MAKKQKVVKTITGLYEIRPNKVNISEYMTKDIKTSGVVVRGTGSQTKGKLARGPMG
mgnify:FL=1